MTASRPGVLSTDTEGWQAFAFFNTEKPTDCPRRIWCAYYIYIYPQTTAPFLNKIREFTNEIAILLIKGFSQQTSAEKGPDALDGMGRGQQLGIPKSTNLSWFSRRKNVTVNGLVENLQETMVFTMKHRAFL